MTAVINELMSPPGEHGIALILDGYHLIDTSQVHGSVAFLLDRLPGLRLVLVTRADPSLPPARLRARGQLTELGWACRRRRLPRCRTGPRAGRPGCSWPRYRCRGTLASPMIGLRGKSRGWVAGMRLFRSVPWSRVIRCGQCRWLRSSLRVVPGRAGGRGADSRQRAVRRSQSEGRPAAWGGEAE